MNASHRYTVQLVLGGLAAVIFLVVPAGQVHAQLGGFQFGTGFGWAQQPLRFTSPREDLPYFAKFPPVYYGDMVRRPYGFSPYALPPGIPPVELAVIEQQMGPRTIINPFFHPARPVRIAPPAPPAPPLPPRLRMEPNSQPQPLLDSAVLPPLQDVPEVIKGDTDTEADTETDAGTDADQTEGQEPPREISEQDIDT